MFDYGLLGILGDFFMVVGSSLVVQPAASLPLVAKKSGANLLIVNRDRTPLDGIADLVIPGSAGEALPRIVVRVEALLSAP